MARTPDRRPGALEEDEEIRFYANLTPPTVSGAFNFDGNDFVLYDQLGYFNPRGGGIFTVSGGFANTPYTASFGSGSYAADVGTDVFFYVSGSVDTLQTTTRGVAAFGGDVRITGSLSQGTSTVVQGRTSYAGGYETTAGLRHYNTDLLLGQAMTNYVIKIDSAYGDVSTDISGSNGENNTLRLWGFGYYYVGTVLATSFDGTNTYITSSGFDAPGNFGGPTAAGPLRVANVDILTGPERTSNEHAEGLATSAIGGSSHAEGLSTIAAGIYSHAEGANNIAVGEVSHAEGSQTVAAGYYSHAEGSQTVALGVASHAGGEGTVASGSYQTVIGKWNVLGNDSSLLVVGDGYQDLFGDVRSDVFRVNSGSSPGLGRVEVTGSFAATLGLSGSLTTLVDGTSYLVAGSGIDIASSSNGSIVISSISPEYWQSVALDEIYTTGSVKVEGFVTASLGFSGSLTSLSDGTSYLVQSGNILITSQSNGSVTIGTTAVNSSEHARLRQLIHFVDEGGPFEGFTAGSYREILPTGDPFPTSVIWWEDSSKVKKIVEETVTYNSLKLITTDEWKVYNEDGVTVAATATDTISYSGAFETDRTRTIT